MLWRPKYYEAVGGVGESGYNVRGAPPSVTNFYQNLDDDQEVFQFVSNPKVSLL